MSTEATSEQPGPPSAGQPSANESAATAPAAAIEAPPILPVTDGMEARAIAPPSVPPSQPTLAPPARWWRALMFPVKFLWGMLFCQSLLGGILVVGWAYRLAQRSAFKYWWRRSVRPPGAQTFAEFLNANARLRELRHWPNWFFAPNFRQAIRRPPDRGVIRHALRLVPALGASLWTNLWTGLQGIANVWALTLPACALWWFGWYDGWNNSFNKGYEQAAVGPVLSLLGIALFIAAMYYVPLAQARQAVTGEWRAFYDFRTVWQVVRMRWLACVGLALLFALLSVPLTVLKVAAIAAPKDNPGFENFSDAAALQHLGRYFFWCSAAVLPAFVALRLVATRIYASALLAGVQTGRLAWTCLADAERDALLRLDLLRLRPQPSRHFLVRFLAWTGTRLGRVTAGVAMAFVWFAFVAQIYIAEFLNYHTALGWINQPLVQLPWFRYIPPRLKNPLAEVGVAVLAVAVAVVGWAIVRKVRSLRARG